MSSISLSRIIFLLLVTMLMAGSSRVAMAQAVPGPADPARIERKEPESPDEMKKKNTPSVTTQVPTIEIPKGAEARHLIVKQVMFDGATAYDPDELLAVAGIKQGTEISLADIYRAADALTKHYRDDGYFLSRVNVNEKATKKGIVHFQVVEGYVKEVTLTDLSQDNYVLRAYIDRIKREKPLTSHTLEGNLLRMNDLPGQSFRAVLAALPNGGAGATQLTLIPQETSIDASMGFDNSSSKFLGPHEMNMGVGGSIIPLNQTSFYGLTSTDPNQMNYGSVHNLFYAWPDVVLNVDAGITRAHPMYTLEPLNIDSVATNLSFGVKYQWVRQRQENFATAISFDMRDVNSDISGTALTREQVRVVRANVDFNAADEWQGTNLLNVKVSQGIDGLGSSKAGDLNLSRTEAKPDFTKAELYAARLQDITSDWSVLAKFSAQISSGPLYSSEEFGYGGGNFGRAYDYSELVGDQGYAAGLEVRYGGLRSLKPVNFEPYAFVDYGNVFNDDSTQVKDDSAASAGIGLRFATAYGQSGNLGIAFPINHSALAPLYSANHNFPRIIIQLSQKF